MQAIYICEDNPAQLAFIKKVIENYIMIEVLGMEVILATPDPMELLEHVKKQAVTNAIYFLDIELNHELDGIQLAQQIRELDDIGRVVFITTHAELAPVTFRYKVEALDYIVKNSPEQIQEQIIEVLNIIEKRQPLNAEEKQQFVFQVGSKTRFVPYDSILYFESLPQPHKIGLITTQGHYQFYESLKAIEKVAEQFVRVHKSFIANLPLIASVNQKEQLIYFKDGSTCPLAVSRAKNLLTLLKEESRQDEI